MVNAKKLNEIIYSSEVERVMPDQFEPQRHFYPQVLNAHIHSLVAYFLNMTQDRVLARYGHLNPLVDPKLLRVLLNYRPRFLKWAGSDLFKVTNGYGVNKMVVIETNSCPSGQKSMPTLNPLEVYGGYQRMLQCTALEALKTKKLPKGHLAVVYDKNYMEASGYAAMLAELTKEPVYLVNDCDQKQDRFLRFRDGILEVLDHRKWKPIRYVLRYVTQKPWNRFPLSMKTQILNPILACLAGGRNKLLAAKAYDLFNSEYSKRGIYIRTPKTLWNVAKEEIPYLVRKLGGQAVVKVPYSNAGQGVFTITSEKELSDFMEQEFFYDQFIVQHLIGHAKWSSEGKSGTFYHVGTVPNHKKEVYVADLRVMVCTSPSGFQPVALYSRRSRLHLHEKLDGKIRTWDMLGTNLSVKLDNGKWSSDTSRLLIMDQKNFDVLGVSLDDLIEAFLQTVFSVVAIDKFACHLMNKRGKFNQKLFQSLNKDKVLIQEMMGCGISMV